MRRSMMFAPRITRPIRPAGQTATTQGTYTLQADFTLPNGTTIPAGSQLVTDGAGNMTFSDANGNTLYSGPFSGGMTVISGGTASPGPYTGDQTIDWVSNILDLAFSVGLIAGSAYLGAYFGTKSALKKSGG